MIKNIVFDMGGVLIDWSPEIYINRYNLTDEDKVLLKRVVFDDYRWPLLDFGYYKSEQDFLNDIYPDLPERLRPIADELVLHWDQPGILNYPEMADLCRQLKENGYKLYLLSNAGPRHNEYWPKVAASEYFDGKVVSAYEKQYKPCIDIYETLLKRFDLKADECVFTDDLRVNCSGAFMAGFHTIVFRNPEDLKINLRKLGVRI